MTIALWTLGALGLALLGLTLLRASDRRLETKAIRRLAEIAQPDLTFDPAQVEHLPEPARRYFLYAIAPGAALRTVAEIEMSGEIGLGSKQAPAYRPMHARQILAAPHGLVWRLKAGPISGSDGLTPEASWTRFWLFGLAPIVRAGGADHHRSAFGRMAAEASFWSPASLLPSPWVQWRQIDENSARATLAFGGLEQSIDLTVNPDGQPIKVVIERWSNENSERRFQMQPFGGYLADFKQVDGYRLPMRVEGGNWIDTADYFPFYRIRVDRIRMLGGAPPARVHEHGGGASTPPPTPSM